MPSAQVIDFGPDPLTESMDKFASGFSESFFKQQTQKKNEDIFNRIKKKYGPDAKPDRIFRDIAEAEGLDQDYKRDMLKIVNDYATLAGKKDISPYEQEKLRFQQEELNLKKDKAKQDELGKNNSVFQQKKLDNETRRLELEASRLEQAAAKNTKDLPDLVARYTNNVLKDAEEKLSSTDKGLLNERVVRNIQDDKMTTDQAFNEALDYVSMKNQIVETAQIEKRPVSFRGLLNPSPEELNQSMEKAYKQLNELYDSGVESQKDLRTIAQKNGWKPEEITKLLQAVYSSHGKKAREPKKEQPTKLDVDEILFGE